MTSEKKDGTRNDLVKLEGTLSAYEVAAAKERLLNALEESDGITVDIGGISDCDTLGIQLLCAAAKAAKMKNKNFSISGKSEACETLSRNIGMDLDALLNA